LKVTYNDGAGHEANDYFHGLPLAAWAAQNSPTAGPQITANGGGRAAGVTGNYQQSLFNFVNTLRLQGLGFRAITNAWSPNMNVISPAVSGVPTSIYYALPGTPPQSYTFIIGNATAATLTQTNPVAIPSSKGRYRMILRGFQAPFNALNGRFPAVLFQIAAGNIPSGASQPVAGQWAINVLARFPNYLPWNNTGYLCPEAWSYYSPAPCPPTPNTGLVGASALLITSKKTGRPFDLQRGRQRNRVR
jgi:hypothetical protein